MRPAEPDHGICRIAKANEGSADFEVKIDFGGAGNIGLPEVKDGAEKEDDRNNAGSDEDARALFPKKPDDLAPTTHENPQMPKKRLQRRENAS